MERRIDTNGTNNTNKSRVCLCFVLFLLAGGISAQSPVVLTADAAVEEALKNSHQLKSAAIDLEIQKRGSDNAWNTLLPSAQVTGTASRSNEYTDSTAALMKALNPQYPVPEETEDDHWALVFGATLSWNFNAAMVQSIKAAHANYEAGLITWEQTQKQVERDVRKMFYALLLQQESLKIQKESLASAKSRADQAETNYRNGRIPQLQLLQAQVAYENQKPSVLKAEQNIGHQLDTFAFLLGFPPGTKITLDGSIDAEFAEAAKVTPDAATVKNISLGARPDLRLLYKNIDALTLQLSALNLSAYSPSLALSFGYQPYSSLPTFKDDSVDWDDKWYDNGSFSFSLAWNLTNMLPFSQSRQQAKDLQANIAKLRLTADMLTDQAANEVTSLMDSLELSMSQIEANERNVSLAQTSYTMTETSYRNGTTELLDLRDAESQLDQAKLGVVSEKFNYLSALLDLEYSLNTKFLGK